MLRRINTSLREACSAPTPDVETELRNATRSLAAEEPTRSWVRLGLVLLLAAFAACGPAGGDDVEVSDSDSDGDSISDPDESAPDTDTDGDGTPDFQDDDSDGDGVPDYREAGDTDPTTQPNDSDGDGTPDFQDTDADDNGRPDGDDGIGDVDDDGRADFADLDDDGDLMDDVDEIGGNPAAPLDSDGDGTFDYQDLDSDDDTVRDYDEGPTDYDMDGIGNYLDLDSDQDCISDQSESGGTSPPRDADDDNRMDFIDRDSDNDGIPDGTEDANCNGARDGTESSATDDDTDGDGVSDLVEVAAGTDANNAGSNPQANGDFVFVEPYQQPQTPLEDDLDFATDLVSVDVYVLVDRSGSMSTEITAVRDNLAAAIDNLQCPPLGNGSTVDCIPDLWAGGGTVGYAHSTGDSYLNFADIQPNPNFAGLPITSPSGTPNTDEAMTYALWSTITGSGSSGSGCTVETLSARTNCNTNSPAHTAGYSAYGYPCFRQGALPVVLLATDEAPLDDGADTVECPAWTTVRTQYTNRSARVVGIKGSSPPAAVQTDLATMATATGAIDAANGNAPLVFDGAGANADDAISQGIRTLADGIPLDLSAPITDDPTDSVNAVTAFVDHLETQQLGTPQCANMLTDTDTNADGHDDFFVNVRAGTPVCWKLVSKPNTTVPPTTEPQLFRATIEVYGDGITVLDTRDVYFLVPPGSFDEPVD